jgi:hypothetical protein
MTRAKAPAAGASGGGAARTVVLFVDAVEDDWARLVLGDEAFDVPVRLLPPGTGEGAWLTASFAPAPAPPDGGGALRQKLGKDDDGGDIKL